jgi:hypothetical protein
MGQATGPSASEPIESAISELRWVERIAQGVGRGIKKGSAHRRGDAESMEPFLEAYGILVSAFRESRQPARKHIMHLRQLGTEDTVQRLAGDFLHAEFSAMAAVLRLGEDIGEHLWMWGNLTLVGAVNWGASMPKTVAAAADFFGLRRIERHLAAYRASVGRELDLGALFEAQANALEESFLRSVPRPLADAMRAYLAGEPIEPEAPASTAPVPDGDPMEKFFWPVFDEDPWARMQESLLDRPFKLLQGLSAHVRSVASSAYRAEAPRQRTSAVEDWLPEAASPSTEDVAASRAEARSAKSELRRQARRETARPRPRLLACSRKGLPAVGQTGELASPVLGGRVRQETADAQPGEEGAS